MKKVLGMIVSPRRLGNCEIFVKEISRNIPEPHELNLLRLSDFNIKPCRGCYICLFKKEQCILKDDLYTVLKSITDTDALILAVPTYFLGANGCLKRFLDRGLAFYAHAEKIWGKPSVGVGIAGIEGKEGYTLLGIQNFLKMILSEIKTCTVVYGALPGEILLNEQNKKTATSLGKALFGPSIQKESPSCPLCGGDTFRFLENSKVRCALCSNSGELTMEKGEPVFNIVKDKHGLFLSKEEAFQHREWLRDQVKRFAEQKERLERVRLSYKEKGNWIKPK